jgi:hypothetical protein
MPVAYARADSVRDRGVIAVHERAMAVSLLAGVPQTERGLLLPELAVGVPVQLLLLVVPAVLVRSELGLFLCN